MRITKGKVFLAALAVSLVAIIAFGSLAWFSDTDAVKNQFMIATSSDVNPDDVFSVDAYEIKPDGSEEQTGLEYNDILPGDTLEKKAHVRNTGYYDQYVRVIVTISDAPAWQAAYGTGFGDSALLNAFTGFDASKWDMDHSYTEVYDKGTADTSDDVIRIVLYYKDILNGDQNAPAGDVTVFEGVNIANGLTQYDAVRFDDDGTAGFTIDVEAQAVQTQNVVPSGTTAGCEAYAAFQTVGMALPA